MKTLFLLCFLLVPFSVQAEGELKPDYPPIEESIINLQEDDIYVCGARIGDKMTPERYIRITQSCAGGIKMFSMPISSKKDWAIVPLKEADHLVVEDGPTFKIQKGKIVEVFFPGMMYGDPDIISNPSAHEELVYEMFKAPVVERHKDYFLSKRGNTMISATYTYGDITVWKQ